ncbi:hypothetical protein S40293_03158 [Stachybotrys chartarum IBT 40293]|nr:hypothetical protein S40293_03158 [Stachybotrys chartarum IBT 40293]
MTGHITYNGVASTVGGDIFKDVSFWVAQRVPQRGSIVDSITNNGGQVVQLEKYADILIADHARRDAPPNSYSWKLITDSMQHGMMQLKDRYRIGPDPDMPRPSGGGRPTKPGRTPFLPHEDAALASWVLAHSNNRTGNKIFQEFERKYPRHTWQSWRNRYIKNLQILPMDQLQQLAAKAATVADGQEQNTPEPSNEDVALQQPRPLEEAVPVQHNAPRPGANDASVSRPPSLVEFAPPQDNNPRPDVHSTSSPRPLARREVVRAQPDMVADSVEQPEHDDQQTTPEQDAVSEPVPSESGQEDAFHEDLETYKQATGSTIQPRPRIAGKSVELWDLLQTVAQYDIECRGAPDGREPVGDTAANWDKVAVDLGYDLTEAAGINRKLRRYYIQKVLPFLDWDYARNGKDEEDEEDEEGAEQGDHNEPDVAEENAASPRIGTSPSPQSYMPSSPPINGFKRKRSPSTFAPYSSGHGPKRRRLSPNAEIPATPEPETSPAKNALADDRRSSKGRRNLHLNDHVSGSEASQQLPPLPDPQEEQSVEPETQDFEVAVHQQPPRFARQESSFDVTPSQQLRSENCDSTPIPIDLDRGRRHQDTSSSEPPSVQRPPSARTTATTNLLSASRGTVPPAAPQPASTASRNTTPVVKAKRRPLPTSWRQEPSPRPAATVRSPRSSPRSDGSANRPRTGNINLDLISQWVEHYESLGYTNETVVEALKSTTMIPGGLAGIVMESLKHGQGIPAHYEGVWTPRDDKSLRVIMAARRSDAAADTDEAQIHQRDMAAKALKRLKNKHGEEGIELRQKFLAAQPGSDSRLYQG